MTQLQLIVDDPAACQRYVTWPRVVGFALPSPVPTGRSIHRTPARGRMPATSPLNAQYWHSKRDRKCKQNQSIRRPEGMRGNQQYPCETQDSPFRQTASAFPRRFHEAAPCTILPYAGSAQGPGTFFGRRSKHSIRTAASPGRRMHLHLLSCHRRVRFSQSASPWNLALPFDAGQVQRRRADCVP
jgi:hypothetical protein